MLTRRNGREILVDTRSSLQPPFRVWFNLQRDLLTRPPLHQNRRAARSDRAADASAHQSLTAELAYAAGWLVSRPSRTLADREWPPHNVPGRSDGSDPLKSPQGFGDRAFKGQVASWRWPGAQDR